MTKILHKSEQECMDRYCYDIKNSALKTYTGHYCIILSGNGKYCRKKVAFGSNKTIKQYNTPTLHAEIDAIKKLDPYYAIRGVDLIVIGLTRDGTMCKSRPCYHCLRTLKESGIRVKNIYYSDTGEKIRKERFIKILDNPLTYISSGMRKKLQK